MRHNLRKCPEHRFRVDYLPDGRCPKCNGYSQDVRELEDVIAYKCFKDGWAAYWDGWYPEDTEEDKLNWYTFDEKGKPIPWSGPDE